MAEQQGSWFENGGAVNHAVELRRIVQAILGDSQGLARPGDLAVTARSTPNMSVNVGVGDIFVRDTSGTGRGTYHGYNDGTVNKAVAPLGNPAKTRADLAVAEILNSEYGVAGDKWQLRVVTGTEVTSGPADPTVTGNVGYVALARIVLPAGATSVTAGMITAVAPYAGALPAPPSWQQVPLATGMTNRLNFGYAMTSPYKGVLKGGVQKTDGTDFTAGNEYVVGTLPSGARPAQETQLAVATEWRTGTATRAWIGANGDIHVTVAYAVKWIAFDGSEFFTA